MEYGFGYIIIGSPYTPYSIYLRGDYKEKVPASTLQQPPTPSGCLQDHRAPFGFIPKLGVPFWGPNNKDYRILGSTLGSLVLGNYHLTLTIQNLGQTGSPQLGPKSSLPCCDLSLLLLLFLSVITLEPYLQPLIQQPKTWKPKAPPNQQISTPKNTQALIL